MTDKKISQDPRVTPRGDLLIPVVDTQNSLNGTVTLQEIASKITGPRGPLPLIPLSPLLGGSPSALIPIGIGKGLSMVGQTLIATGAVGGGDVQTVEVGVLNKNVPSALKKGSQFGVQIYKVTDPKDTSAMLLLSVEVQYQDKIGAKFTYDIWQGVPNATDGNSALLASAGQDLFFTTRNPKFASSATAYLSNQALRIGIYMNVTNRLTSPINFSVKLSFLKVPAPVDPVTLPEYVNVPFVYTGPVALTTVDVGPEFLFKEPADALPFMAPGFTMNIHKGNYFRCIRIASGMGGQYGVTIQAAPGVKASDIVWTGRGGWVTGQPRWTDNNSATNGNVNPFRLSQGKGIIQLQDSATIIGLAFWDGGGGYGEDLPDNIGDGEAGVYVEPTASFVRIVRCTFDGNENGIFCQRNETSRLFIEHCTFSEQVVNGITPDGQSHNYYLYGHFIQVVSSVFYCCRGNTTKSRANFISMDECYMEQGDGRCIDFPSGGTLRVSNSVFGQKPGAELNFLGIANENSENGDGFATFIGCILMISRFDSSIFIGGDTSFADFAPPGLPPCELRWYKNVGEIDASLAYLAIGRQSGVHGLPMGSRSTDPGFTVLPGPSPRPGPAHELPPTLIIDEMVRPNANTDFTLTGKTSGYYAVPTLKLSIDGGSFEPLPAGSQVSFVYISIPMTGLPDGLHQFQLKDQNGITSRVMKFTVGQVISGGGGTGGNNYPGGEIVPTIVAGYPHSFAPVVGQTFNVMVKLSDPTDSVISFFLVPESGTPETVPGYDGAAGGMGIMASSSNFTNGVDRSDGYTFTVSVQESVPANTTYYFWVIARHTSSKITQEHRMDANPVVVGDNQTTTYS